MITTQNTNEPGAHDNTLITTGGPADEYNESEFTFCQNGSNTVAYNMATRSNNLPETWILLDNQSTIDVFANRKLLKNIRKIETSMHIHCTAGVTRTNTIGDLPGYGTVWYHPSGIANILSLARVRKAGYDVTYSSKDGNVFKVTKKDGTI